jgi:transcriptional regulator with XRE-family HTH domain
MPPVPPLRLSVSTSPLVSPFVVVVIQSVQVKASKCQLWCTLSVMADTAGSSPRLGRELFSARHESGRSLREVATAADISAAYLQKLERGQVAEPSPKILSRLADALMLDYRKLLDLAGYDVPSNRSRRHPLTARFAAADLTETEERAVSAFIEHLVAQRQR